MLCGSRLLEEAAGGAFVLHDTRLYLDPARSADLLEVVTIVRADGSELALHAMREYLETG